MDSSKIIGANKQPFQAYQNDKFDEPSVILLALEKPLSAHSETVVCSQNTTRQDESAGAFSIRSDMKAIKYSKNQVIGNNGLLFVEDIGNVADPNGRKRRAAKILCHCGKEFITRINDVVSNKTKSCGCNKGSDPKPYNSGDLINGIKFLRDAGKIGFLRAAYFQCPVCNKDWLSTIANVYMGHSKSCCNKGNGWQREVWVRKHKTISLYKLRFENDSESFIKIGIASDLKKRIPKFPYKCTVLKTITGETGYIYDLELRTKRLFSKFKYKPQIPFEGQTECYREN
jgi:hypothetical protein